MPVLDVDGAIGHREGPAIAGQLVGFAGTPVPQLQPALHPLALRPGALEVGAHRRAHRAGLVALAPHGDGQARGITVSGHHDRGAELASLIVAHPDDAIVGGDRLGDIDAGVQRDAQLHRVARQHIIEARPRAHGSRSRGNRPVPAREARRTGTPAVDPQSLVARPPGRLGGIDAQPRQHAHGAWREARRRRPSRAGTATSPTAGRWFSRMAQNAAVAEPPGPAPTTMTSASVANESWSAVDSWAEASAGASPICTSPCTMKLSIRTPIPGTDSGLPGLWPKDLASLSVRVRWGLPVGRQPSETKSDRSSPENTGWLRSGVIHARWDAIRSITRRAKSTIVHVPSHGRPRRGATTGVLG